jgi:hypothetical protein
MTDEARRVANIGSGERRKRRLLGLAGLVAGTLVIGLGVSARSSAWLVAVFAFFFLGALGVLQARAHT